VYGNNVEIADVAVAPDCRGRGVGTALITVLMRIAAFAGFESIEICVMQDNVRARALYERLGFIFDRSFSLTESATVAVLRKALRVQSGERPLGGTEHEH
jgi:ribosomal protein S18 acetylase RimI-like enzyme